MRARDIFNEAREARIRIDDLQERSLVMRERIGMRGRSVESVFTQVLDPMRKVDDLIDWESEEYHAIMAASMAAIEDAEDLARGLAGMGYADAARALRLYYVNAMDLSEVCGKVGHGTELVKLMLDTALRFIDENGIARVKEAGR